MASAARRREPGSEFGDIRLGDREWRGKALALASD